jgi:hypothetical protein
MNKYHKKENKNKNNHKSFLISDSSIPQFKHIIIFRTHVNIRASHLEVFRVLIKEPHNTNKYLENKR